jgi:hypothetical protein
MRESYRLFKNEWYQLLNKKDLKANCAFIYIGNTENSYQQIDNALRKLLRQGVNKLQP